MTDGNVPAPEFNFDDFQMELRGYEVAKKDADGFWQPVARYRPNELARRHAIKHTNHLNYLNRLRGGGIEYKTRPVVSIDVDFAAARAPLVLDADEGLVTPEELSLQPAPEESLIVKPEGEFDGTGFKVTTADGAIGNVEIPYNYDQLAGEAPIPDPWGNDGKG